LVGGVGVMELDEAKKIAQNTFRLIEDYFLEYADAELYEEISPTIIFFKELTEGKFGNIPLILNKYENDFNNFVKFSQKLSKKNRIISTRDKEKLFNFSKKLQDGLIKDILAKNNTKNIKVDTSMNNNQSNTDNLNIMLDDFQNKSSETFNKFEHSIKSKYEEFENNLTSILEEAKKRKDQYQINLKDKTEEIKKIVDYADSSKKAFDEEHKLHAAKVYWQNKAQRHNKTALGTLFLFFIPILLIISISFTIAQDILVVDTNQTIINTANTLTQTSFLNLIPYLVIFSLLIWISRIFLKVTFSNLHLQEEALEKETQILTYLSLIKEGAGLEKEDRKLILESIFRPSTNGLIKDESNVTLLDIANIFKGK
jgi:hypothetical protein